MEPGVEFTLVYQYSAPGSLRIIAGLRGLVTSERLKELAIVVVTLLISNGFSEIQSRATDEALKAIIGEETSLTDKDIQRIAEAVKRIEKSDTVAGPRREFYRAVEPDKAIAGVGATPNESSEPPAIIIPRSEFNDRAGVIIEKPTEDGQEQRTLSERIKVVLVQPPLIESRRMWRFFWNGKEEGAKMLDEDFKTKLLKGETSLKLAGGVVLDVTLETTQEKRDGLWHNKSFSITEVHGWDQNVEQADMLLSNESNDDYQSDQNNQ
jgi:hypothetical protein